MKTLNVVKYVILVLASVMFLTLLVYSLIVNFQNCNLKRGSAEVLRILSDCLAKVLLNTLSGILSDLKIMPLKNHFCPPYVYSIPTDSMSLNCSRFVLSPARFERKYATTPPHVDFYQISK
jgi:hypothetical protein